MILLNLKDLFHHRHQIQQSALENKITKATFQIYDFKNYIKNYENIKETLHTEIGIPPQQGKKPNLTDIRNKIIRMNHSNKLSNVIPFYLINLINILKN